MTTVPDAILSTTSDDHIRRAMLTGSYLESSWRTGASGDSGSSWGPFQINHPSHPGVTQTQADDPVWAARYMLGAYTAGVAKVPASLWASNPEKAAELGAYYAEKPAQDYYTARGSATVSDAYAHAVSALSGKTVTPSTSSNSTGNTSGTGSTNVQPVGNWFSDMISGAFGIDMKDASIRFGLIVLGGCVLLIGLVLAFKGGNTSIFKGIGENTQQKQNAQAETATPEQSKDSGTDKTSGPVLAKGSESAATPELADAAVLA